ncbi:TPA: hypothetical protein ACU9KK_003327, partial [Legionella anisa]
LIHYLMCRSLLEAYSFHPEGIVKTILRNYRDYDLNMDYFPKPPEKEYDHAKLLTLAEVITGLANKRGDAGYIFQANDSKQAFESEKKLVHLYYQVADSILNGEKADYLKAKKFLAKFKDELNKLSNYAAVQMPTDKNYKEMIDSVEKEINYLFVKEQLELLQVLGKDFISANMMLKLKGLDIAGNKIKITQVLSDVHTELKKNKAPSSVCNMLYNICKFLGIESVNLFKGFFHQQKAIDTTNELICSFDPPKKL